MEKIPVFAPYIDKDTLAHVEKIFKIGWLGLGSATKEFEERISKFLNLKDRYVLCTNTGTSALHISLLSADIGPGDEVITPSFNYVADHHAIRMTGAEVVMCDIKENNLGIDCKKAEELISEKTKAIIPLHFAGIPCDIDEVNSMAKKYDLRVIEDAMHGFGTKINNKKIGSLGDITCFSFDPVKIVTSIDGGCIIVNTKEELENLQRLRLLGVDKDTTLRYKNNRAWDYDVISEGYRYHMNSVSAGIGISQIKRVKEFIETRQEVCQQYNLAFSNIPGITLTCDNFSNISPFIYTIRILDNKREKLIQHLKNLGIDVGIHFIPVHKHKFFINSKHGDMTVTEKVVDQIVTLPLHSHMKKEYVRRVIDGITSFYSS
ncbi:MAG: DegT/DnrJ/EryC1/StrS family aminotransferase [Thaumarchaeota archaeon]|jgi:dTDP-4-amino-4,6-dideoxygalactose transaminase|nr:MAG: DegT/DnrJ/EryC1/StrS family aminotransferase [Nitrososphaerota archaeon]